MRRTRNGEGDKMPSKGRRRGIGHVAQLIERAQIQQKVSPKSVKDKRERKKKRGILFLLGNGGGGSNPITNFKHTDPSLSKQIQSNVSKESLNNKTVLVDVLTVF